MTNLRFQVVEEAFKKKPVEVIPPVERPSEYYGKNVFNRAKMYKYLPADIYDKLVDVIDNGARLDRSIADGVAAGIRQWAEENGVTLVPAPHRRHRRKARCLYRARWQGWHD